VNAIAGVAGLRDLIGAEPRVGAWIAFDREALERFDVATFHAPSVNYAGPATSSAAHGSQALGILLAQLDTVVPVVGVARVLLYGLDRMRMPAPLAPGSRVRATFAVAELRERGAGAYDCGMDGALEVEGARRPACVARVVLRLVG
jgi:acyl dehydratase